MPKDSTQYELIGTCLSKKHASSYSVKNFAMVGINKCACHNKGDLVRIISAKEFAHKSYLIVNGLPDFLNPNSPKYIEKDHVLANVYRKKID